MTTQPEKPTTQSDDQRADPDDHKGAVEGDRPGDPQTPNRQGSGVNKDGMPDNPVASAEDALGAEVDETQG